MRFLGAGGKMGFGPGRSTYATGGDYVYLYEDTDTGIIYRVHEFHTTGTSTLNVEVGGQMEYLIVGGGGGGGYSRFGGNYSVGGGGGGGATFGTIITSKDESITITVGSGGTAGTSTSGAGDNGSDSSFDGITAFGGGGGGGFNGSVWVSGKNGGAGGGGVSTGRGFGTTGQGEDGGSWRNPGGGAHFGGGGGGVTEDGHQTTGTNPYVAGAGGAGLEWPQGSGKYYGGGGGAGGWDSSTTPAGGGTGGIGGGGNGGAASGTKSGNGKPGENRTGGGGGGGGRFTLPAGAGGSGIVIVRYPLGIVEYYDIEAGQNLGTPTATQSSAGTWTLGEISNQNLVLAFDAIFPSTPAQGCLAEKGGATLGFWCGLKSSGTYFRVRAGGGGSAPAANIAEVDIYDFPADDKLHTVVVEIKIDGGMTMRVWIDGILKGTDTSTATSAAGTGSGVFLSGGANVNITDEPTAAWPGGTAQGEARFYSNTLIS